MRQGEAGPYANFQDAAARHSIGQADGAAPSDRGYTAEHDVVDAGPALIGGANVIGIKGGARSSTLWRLQGVAHGASFLPVVA
jgi:hypothetical protein